MTTARHFSETILTLKAVDIDEIPEKIALTPASLKEQLFIDVII